MMAEEIEMIVLGEDDIPPDDSSALIADSRSINIERNSLNEADFEKGFRPVSSEVKKNWYKIFIPPEPILSSLLPPMTRKELVTFFFTHFPIFGWIWTYQLNYFIGDIIAGITVAIMHIPQGLAYSQLAGLDPIYGLYASFVPVIIYSLFGTSRHISVGTFAVVCLMVSNAVDNVVSSQNILACTDNYTDYNEYNQSCADIKLDIAVTLSFISGGIMILMGICQLGWITIFLSEPLISGYTTGAAVHVFTSQLKHIFGLSLESRRGILSVLYTWIDGIAAIFDWPNRVNTAAFIISVLTITALIIFRIIDRKLLRKLKLPCYTYSRPEAKCTVKKKVKWLVPIPSQLIVVIVATVISYLANLKKEFQVDIIDEIPLGLPNITAPNFSYGISLFKDAFVISIVTFSISVSLSQVFAKQFTYSISSSQELIAYGLMNVVGSFFSSFNTAGSLSRSTVQAVSGGKTQLVGFISSSIIFVVLIALGFLFSSLPNAVLASIIWVALYGMFSQILDLWRYFKLSYADMFTWIVVFTATVLLGVDLGLAVGIAFLLLTLVWKLILPKSSKLGKAPNTEIYRDIQNFEMVKSIKGVVIYRFQAPLCFVNCKVLQSRLDLVCGIKRSCFEDSSPGCIQSVLMKVSKIFKKQVSFDLIPQHNPNTSGIHTLILDCSPIGFMDSMGVKTLQQLVVDFDNFGIQVLFASLTKNNRDFLERVGFFKKCGKQWLFPSIQDAVNFTSTGKKLHPEGVENQSYETTKIDIDGVVEDGNNVDGINDDGAVAVL